MTFEKKNVFWLGYAYMVESASRASSPPACGVPVPSVETAGSLVSCLFFQHTFCSPALNILAFIISLPTINLCFISISCWLLGVCCLSAAEAGWLGLGVACRPVVRGRCCGYTHNADSALSKSGAYSVRTPLLSFS